VRPLWLIRERYELRFAGHHRKPAFSRIGFRLFDRLGGTRDEIPPKVTWLVERLAAEQEKPSRFNCAYGDHAVLLKHQHPASFEGVAGDLDTAFGDCLLAWLAAKWLWTLSVWEDETALRAFVAPPQHAAVMKALAPHMGATRFTSWTVKGSDPPLQWDDTPKGGEPAG
jgi:hypothetical protein